MSAPASPLFLTDSALLRGADLLYGAQQSLEAALAPGLEQHRLGLSHYRALRFIATRSGLAVGDLQALLRVSKQSLHRTLAPLHDRELVRQKVGRTDRRARALYLTEAGTLVLDDIETGIKSRIAGAYKAAGGEAVGGFWSVLQALEFQ